MSAKDLSESPYVFRENAFNYWTTSPAFILPPLLELNNWRKIWVVNSKAGRVAHACNFSTGYLWQFRIQNKALSQKQEQEKERRGKRRKRIPRKLPNHFSGELLVIVLITFCGVITHYDQEQFTGPGKMSQRLRALAALSEDPSPVLSTQTAAHNRI